MDVKAIKTLGYIYAITDFNKKLKRVWFKDIQTMGNHTLVITEDTGLLDFNKGKPVEKGGKIFFLSTKGLLAHHKRYCEEKQKYYREEKNRYQELYAKAKLNEDKYKLSFQEINVQVQEKFMEDKQQLKRCYRYE